MQMMGRNGLAPAADGDLSALHVLEALGFSVALLSADLRLIECGAKSRPLFESVFCQSDGRVVFCAAPTRRRFDAIMSASGSSDLAAGAWASDVFKQPRQDALPLLIRIMAAHRKHDAAALVVVLDLERDS